MVEAKARPQVAPSSSSCSGASSSFRYEALDGDEEVEGYEGPAEYLDDFVQRDWWARRACGSLNVRFTQCALVGHSVSCDGRSGRAIGLATLVAISASHGGLGVNGHLAIRMVGYAHVAIQCLHAAELAIALAALGHAAD